MDFICRTAEIPAAKNKRTSASFAENHTDNKNKIINAKFAVNVNVSNTKSTQKIMKGTLSLVFLGISLIFQQFRLYFSLILSCLRR